MRLPGGLRRHRTRLLRELEIRITALIRGEHVRVARQCGSNSELLLAVVEVSERAPWRRLDKVPKPDRRPKNESGSARCVAAGFRAERAQQHAVASVAT